MYQSLSLTLKSGKEGGALLSSVNRGLVFVTKPSKDYDQAYQMNTHHVSLESLLNRQNFVYYESIKREVKIKPPGIHPGSPSRIYKKRTMDKTLEITLKESINTTLPTCDDKGVFTDDDTYRKRK